MPEDSIRVLFSKVDELTKELIQIKTLLTENVVINQKLLVERLGRHRKEINELKDEISKIEHTKNEIRHFKSLVIGLLSVIATLMAIIAYANQIFR